MTSEIEAFLLFMPEDLLRAVLRHSNRKCNDVSIQRNKQIPPFSHEEFLACLGILTRLGADRDNLMTILLLLMTFGRRKMAALSIAVLSHVIASRTLSV